MPIALLATLVFISAAFIDYASVKYVQAVSAEQRHRAAGWSVAMYAAGTVGLLAVVDVSLWMILPEALGLFIGSEMAFSRDNSKLPKAILVKDTCHRNVVDVPLSKHEQDSSTGKSSQYFSAG